MPQIQSEEENINFEGIDAKLDEELQKHVEELKVLQDDYEKIEDPNSIGEVVGTVVWEQFINQIGSIAGEDFIKENYGQLLNLTNDAHVQTPENFADGKIATHNHYSANQLKQNYKRYKDTPHKEFRKEYVNPGMDATLPRAGELNSQGVETVTDIYTGRQIPTATKLEDGSNNPKAAQREHVKPSAEIYENTSLQMSCNDEELAAVINDKNNLQGYTTAERNNRKSDKSSDEMEDRDRTAHWEKANEKAEKHIKQKEKEGEERLQKEGCQTQKEEAFRIGGKALRAVLLTLLAALVKDVIRELIAWFRSGKKSVNTFLERLKVAVKTFFSNLKQNLVNAGKTFLTTILTAIWGPIVGTINKAIIFLKQGYKSFKEAIQWLNDPKNKKEPFSIKLLQVGKIITAGLVAGGAILLGDAIEKGLMNIPGFAFPIPMLGSLASLLGIFFGALISGIIGALALRMLDKAIANKQRKLNTDQQFVTKNEILVTRVKQTGVAVAETVLTKEKTSINISERHKDYDDNIKNSLTTINNNKNKSANMHNDTQHKLDDVDDLLNKF